MTTTAIPKTIVRLEAGERYVLTEKMPATLLGGPADLYLASPVSRRERFVTTLPDGALLPPHLESLALTVVARRQSTLVRGGTREAAKLWFEALRRAAPG
jgi:hypothetical protein